MFIKIQRNGYAVLYNHKTELSPLCLGIHLKNGRCDNSDSDIGVVIAITGHGPTPPEGSTFRHRSGVTQPTPLLCLPRKREPSYLSDDFSSPYSWGPKNNYSHFRKRRNSKILRK
ncbi:hypothetical protein AVEN_21012-1 [Araneus ventricosus]|uniref:Uncharacterized protein n=1 Tax=Araneus ventricosus TaxID=182803 RepID=A0A4Y2D8C1_ARAVE|nr:hypothetical protein AVEN_21012-1 [Araneus ventricosus]